MKRLFITLIALVILAIASINVSALLPQDDHQQSLHQLEQRIKDLTPEEKNELRNWVLTVAQLSPEFATSVDFGKNFTAIRSTESDLCRLCKDIIGKFISWIEGKGCGEAKPLAEELCSHVPILKDVCVDLLMKGCGALLRWLAGKIDVSPQSACHFIHMCSTAKP